MPTLTECRRTPLRSRSGEAGREQNREIGAPRGATRSPPAEAPIRQGDRQRIDRESGHSLRRAPCHLRGRRRFRWPPTLERRDAASELVTPKYDGLPVSPRSGGSASLCATRRCGGCCTRPRLAPGRSSAWTSPTSTCPASADASSPRGRTTDWVHWQAGTALLLPRLLAGRREGPVFLTARRPARVAASADLCRPRRNWSPAGRTPGPPILTRGRCSPSRSAPARPGGSAPAASRSATPGPRHYITVSYRLFTFRCVLA